MKRLLLLFFLCSALISISTVESQDFERIAPKPVPPILPEEALKKPDLIEQFKEKKIDKETILLKEPQGLVVWPTIDQVQPKGLEAFGGLQVKGVDFLTDNEAFGKIATKFLSQPVTQLTINQLMREIILLYRRKHRPVVDVIIPEQDITMGVIQIVVLEATLHQVRVEGNRWFRTETIKEKIRLQQEDPIDERRLKEDLDWLNNNPFRHVDLVYTPGEEVGSTDIILRVKDRFPFRMNIGYEDTGNDITDQDRWYAGATWGNVFGLDHRLSYRFTTDDRFDLFLAHAATYVMPLPWRHTLSFFGSYVDSKADLSDKLFDLRGRTWQVSGRYLIPLPRFGSLRHELMSGFDFKRSNNDLEFGLTDVFDTTTDIMQWLWGYNAGFSDSWGSTSIGSTLYYSPGNVSGNNDDDHFREAQVFADSEYVYGRLNADRVTYLPFDFSLLTKSTIQWSDENLLVSEQLGVGGIYSVRGYDERVANGDEGVLISTEIRTPSIPLLQTVGLPNVNDHIQLLGFWDYGRAEAKKTLPEEDSEIDLASVGLGFRYAINQNVSVRFDYGWQLKDDPFNNRKSSRSHLGINLSY